MALGLTWPLKEMSTRNISWGGVKRPVRRADDLTTFMCPLSWNLGASTSWNHREPLQVCNGNCFTCYKLTYLLLVLILTFRTAFCSLDTELCVASSAFTLRPTFLPTTSKVSMFFFIVLFSPDTLPSSAWTWIH